MQITEFVEAIRFMSNEDKDVLVGSIMREYRELGEELNTRLANAERHADAYLMAAHYIKSSNPSSGGLRYSTPMNVFEFITSPNETKENCAEILKLISRRTELFKRLQDMGMEPKDPPVNR